MTEDKYAETRTQRAQLQEDVGSCERSSKLYEEDGREDGPAATGVCCQVELGNAV